MIDLREIRVVDNTFEVTDTIAKNEVLTKKNKTFFNLVLASSLLLIISSLYFSKKFKTDNSKNNTS